MVTMKCPCCGSTDDRHPRLCNAELKLKLADMPHDYAGGECAECHREFVCRVFSPTKGAFVCGFCYMDLDDPV